MARTQPCMNSEMTMYLDHFGLSLHPFAYPPVSDHFYEGAGRGATLDSLIYVLTHGEGEEGIIMVTGEPGSGKTMLCRLLMERLPTSMQLIYLAKTNLTTEELFSSIARELKFEMGITDSCHPASAASIDTLQNLWDGIYAAGRKVVLLIDEAHSLSAETPEALRLLHEHESSRNKWLQIVLFGQTGLESTLTLPPARTVKERISHHFTLQPLNAMTAREYLTFRLRIAGHYGSGIFSPVAMRLIDRASSGLIRQLNVLADKSLMTAFLAQAPEIEAQHVKSAIADSGIKPRLDWRSGRNRSDFLTHCLAGASAVFSVAAIAVLVVLGWQALRPQPPAIAGDNAPLPVQAATSTVLLAPVPSSVSSPTPTSASAPVYSAATASVASSAPPSVPATAPIPKASADKEPARETAVDKPAEIVSGARESAQVEEPAAAGRPAGTGRIYIAGVKLAGYELLEQRVEATLKTVATADKNFYTIQLFATDNIQPDRMERFLARASGLVDLSNLYVHTVKNGEQAKFIVTYGIYTDRDEATMAVSGLPEKYQSAFQPELHALSELD